MPMVMRRKMTMALILSGLALGTLPLGSWASPGHTKSFQANVTIHFGGRTQGLNGHLGTAAVCKAGRLVSVHRASNGSVVGTSVTEHSGQWGPVASAGPGAYYATVDEELRGGYGGVDCLGGTSNTVQAS
jgi:hypothetical protein